MNEPKPDGASHEYVPSVSPYNLDNFPAYKDELLAGVDAPDDKVEIEQTFDPGNVEILTGLLDGLPAVEQQELFNQLYPALPSVYEHDQGIQRLESYRQRHDAVTAADNEYYQRPNFYRNYWRTRSKEEAPDDPQLAELYRRNQASLERTQADMLRPGASLVDATEWYLKLGALSLLDGSEAALVYAANLPFATKNESKKYPLDEQRLNAGCMLSEASLVNQRRPTGDVARQRFYEAQARKLLEPLANDKKSAEWRSAFVHLNDISMREAARLFNEGSGKNELSTMDAARQLATEAQKQLGELLASTHAELLTATPKEHDKLRGTEVELTVLWLYREHLINGTNTAFNHISIHQAFPRNDWPADALARNNKLRHSYDAEVIIGGVRPDGSRGFVIVPVQIKSSKSGEGNGYVPQIVMMRDDGQDTAGIITAMIYRDKGIGGGREKVAAYADAITLAFNRGLNKSRTAA